MKRPDIITKILNHLSFGDYARLSGYIEHLEEKVEKCVEGECLPEGYIMIPESAWHEQVQIELERDKLQRRLQRYQKAINKIDDMFEYGKHTNVMAQRMYSVLDELTDGLVLESLPNKEEIESEEVEVPNTIKSLGDFYYWLEKKDK